MFDFRKILIGMAAMAALFGGSPLLAVELPEKAAQALQQYLAGREPDAVRNGPIEGLYEVAYGAQIFYISADGKYLLKGAFMDVHSGRNITEQRKNQLVKAELKDLGEDKMIVFPADDPKHTITVFTDIDCGYCRKLHSQVGTLNDLGVTVRYLFFPRSGPDTPSYYKAQWVWCADDRQQALTDAKNDKPIPHKSCDNPVDEHLKLVHEFGLRGTPAIVMEDGSIIPGYVPPKRLVAALNGAPLQ